jgi:hypothetical protein
VGSEMCIRDSPSPLSLPPSLPPSLLLLFPISFAPHPLLLLHLTQNLHQKDEKDVVVV